MSERFEYGDELVGVQRALARIAPAIEPPPGLRAKVLAAVEHAAAEDAAARGAAAGDATTTGRQAVAEDAATARGATDGDAAVAARRATDGDGAESRRHAPAQPSRATGVRGWLARHGFAVPSRRLGLALGTVAAAIAIAVGIGTQLGSDSSPTGPLELAGELRAPRGPATAALDVRLLGSGREVTVRSDSLPILPKGEYYELWFVGPGDRPGARNRISAGTFHPDEQGKTDVVLHAAVDPALFPRVEVTAEPGDGDPRPAGPVVLRLRR